MDGISRPDLTPIPGFDAFSPREAAARIAAEDKALDKAATLKEETRLFVRNREQVRRFADFDEVTEISELVEEDNGRTQVLKTQTFVTQEPLPEDLQRQEPGRFLDVLA